MGSILFGDDDPERWADLGISLITLFSINIYPVKKCYVANASNLLVELDLFF